MGLLKINAYYADKVDVCPYCMNVVQTDPHMGCCGEVHSETAYETEDGLHLESEVQLVYPIMDIVRYEILSKYAWRQRIARFKRRFKVKFERVYESTAVKVLRDLTGIRWTKLDRVFLEYIHGSGTIWCYSDQQLKAMRKDSVKRMREAWAKGELLGCNLVPAIREDE